MPPIRLHRRRCWIQFLQSLEHRLTLLKYGQNYWKESGEFSYSMLARTSLTFRGDEIAVIEEFAAERVES